MSKFRIEIDVAFLSEADAIAFLNLMEEWKNKVYQGNETDGIPVEMRARYHECFHDDNPPHRCSNYIDVDFKGDLVEHATKLGEVMKISPDNSMAVSKQVFQESINKTLEM